MAISNELSGDIATAILGRQKLSAGEMLNLKETVLKIHSTLQQMSERNRKPGAIDSPVPGQREGVMKAGR